MNSFHIIFIKFFIVFNVEGARILGWFPGASYSHQVVYLPVMTELARRGHQVLVVTPRPLKDSSIPNYREIDVSSSRKPIINMNLTAHRDSIFYNENMMLLFFHTGVVYAEDQLENPLIKQLISPESKEQFDLIFLEWIYFPSLYPLGLRFNAPIIGITSLPMIITNSESFGNLPHPALGDTFLPYSPPLNFFQRLHTFLFHMYSRYLWYCVELPKHDKIARRHFGNWIPYIGDLQSNVNLVFMTSNPVFHGAKPHVPGVIEVSRLHISKPKSLPEDIQKFIDGAKEGVIYFSLGGNVQSKDLAPHRKQMFLDAFAKLPNYRVLWKWEDTDFPHKPNNVMVSKWLPQGDILAHPKVKAFIMQGGLQSLEEAMEYGVPVIAIPFISDQGYDAQRIADLGIGIKIQHHELTKDVILDALHQLLHNSTYRDNMKKLLELTKDQPQTSMEQVVWWTEYVLRHKTTKHLHSAAADIPLYQLLLLDIFCFIILTLIVLFYVVTSILSFLFSIIFKRNKLKTD